MSTKLFNEVKKLGISLDSLQLRKSEEIGKWVSPLDGLDKSIEESALDNYKLLGWRGYCGEGGLILNLLKSMSFESLSYRHRSTYVEALYAQNVAFEQDRFQKEYLLENVKKASKYIIAQNYDVMSSSVDIETKNDCHTSNDTSCMLDYFPGLEKWMFIELYEILSNQLMFNIAAKFAEDPYEYRRGWPDLTIWKDDCLKFIEVKGPNDQLRKSQIKTISEVLLPVYKNIEVLSVTELMANKR